MHPMTSMGGKLLRSVLAFVGLLGMVAFVVPSAAEAAPQQVTIATTSTGVQLLVLQIADKEGFFAKHGIDATITVVNGDQATIPAVVSGSVNFSVSTSTPALIADSKGAQLQMITSLSTFPEQIVMSKSFAQHLGITSRTPVKQKLEDLKGQTVAVLDVGGGLQYTLEAALASYGINIKSVPVSQIQPYTAELIALKRGTVKVIAPAIPFGQVAVAGGYGVMIANVWGGEVSAIRGEPFEVLDVNKAWAYSHAQTVQAVRAALQDAMNFLHSNPKRAAQVAHEINPAIPLAVINAVIGNGAGYPTTTVITQKQFLEMKSFTRLAGSDVASVKYQQAVWARAR